MGTLGCINDMLRRDKENRELRRLGRERLKEVRNKLIECGTPAKLPDTTIEEMEEIRKRTAEKKEKDSRFFLRMQLIAAIAALSLLLLGWLYSLFCG